MPILLMGLMALAVFIIVGLMLFSAAFSERRLHDRDKANAVDLPGAADEKMRANAASV